MKKFKFKDDRDQILRALAVSSGADGSTAEAWFYRIERTADPWTDWLGMLEWPQPGPWSANVERCVQELCRAADARRLTVVPTTQHFAALWTTFRRHHETLEGSWEYRRWRWLIWNAAALKFMRARHFGDELDQFIMDAKVAYVLASFSPIPTAEADRSLLDEYAPMVLTLFHVAADDAVAGHDSTSARPAIWRA